MSVPPIFTLKEYYENFKHELERTDYESPEEFKFQNENFRRDSLDEVEYTGDINMVNNTYEEIQRSYSDFKIEEVNVEFLSEENVLEVAKPKNYPKLPVVKRIRITEDSSDVEFVGNMKKLVNRQSSSSSIQTISSETASELGNDKKPAKRQSKKLKKSKSRQNIKFVNERSSLQNGSSNVMTRSRTRK